MDFTITRFVLFVLIFVRVASLIAVAPAFGDSAVPAQVKIGLSFFLAAVLFPIASRTAPAIDLQLLPVALAALSEAALGLLLGFVTGLLFAGISYAGEIASFSMGLTMANVFDPERGETVPVIGRFLSLTATVVFLLLNGHHFVLEALGMTFARVPVGGFALHDAMLPPVTALGTLIFVVAVKFAAPVMVALFLTNVGLGLLSRVMPQMNIFAVSFPATIGIGLIVLMSTGPLMIFVFKKLLSAFEGNIVELIRIV